MKHPTIDTKCSRIPGLRTSAEINALNCVTHRRMPTPLPLLDASLVDEFYRRHMGSEVHLPSQQASMHAPDLNFRSPNPKLCRRWTIPLKLKNVYIAERRCNRLHNASACKPETRKALSNLWPFVAKMALFHSLEDKKAQSRSPRAQNLHWAVPGA